MTDMDTLEFYWRCIEADMELSGTPLMPEDVVMSYCGRGASATVTAGEMQRHLRQYQEARERVRELEVDIAEIAKWGQRIIGFRREGQSGGIPRRWISGLETALAKHGEGV
jgi:hypothetical protein